MKDEIKNTQNFIQEFSQQLYIYILELIGPHWAWVFHIIVKLALLVGIFLLVDFIFKFIISSVFRLFANEEKYPILRSVYKSKLTRSFAHLIALLVISGIHTYIFTGAIKDTTIFIIRSINLGFVLIVGGMGLRSLKAYEYFNYIKKDFYKNFALRSISDTIKIIGTFVFSILAICVIFGIKGTTIIGSLGAITAVMVLVFRDTILGFITSLNVATSKNLKVGDWVGIAKYNLEGTIEDIGLLTTRIQNFDKTVSTIPTYDLMSTEVKNLQVMSESNTRRIKKSIIFNIKSFKFIDEQMFERLKDINLIKNYLLEKRAELKAKRDSIDHSEMLINGQQLTNIGTFRKYAYEYLLHNENIDQTGTLLVRQMEITSQGLPLEIYCFTNDSKWEHFEQIQSDIFDHLLVASKEFDLEIMQVALKV